MKIPVFFLYLLPILLGRRAEGQASMPDLFRKFRNDEGVQHYNLLGDITKMLQSKDQKLSSHIELMHVYIFSAKNALTQTEKTKITNTLTNHKYELLVSTKDKNTKLTVHGVEKDGFLSDMYAEILFDKNKVYLMMKGKIHLEELTKMNFSFEGNDMLKKISLP
jgi:hypothetical protein